MSNEVWGNDWKVRFNFVKLRLKVELKWKIEIGC